MGCESEAAKTQHSVCTNTHPRYLSCTYLLVSLHMHNARPRCWTDSKPPAVHGSTSVIQSPFLFVRTELSRHA